MEYSTESDSQCDSIIDEQIIWRKNTKLFYSLLISHRLIWPSLSIEWLKYQGEEKSLGYCTHRLAYGTYTSSQEPEQLIIDALKIPYDNISEKQTETIAKKDNIITNIVSMTHQGESNRIRVNPLNDYIIASKSSNNNIYVYNYENVSKGSNKGLQKLLRGHTEEGFGLSWNNSNMIASGSNDKLVCVWDCNCESNEPLYMHSYHTDIVDDVSWENDWVLASVGDDKNIIRVDTRINAFVTKFVAHDGCINSIEFNKLHPELMITSSSDKSISIWDTRNLSETVKKITTEVEVYSAKWAPFASGLFATTGSDNKILVWNLAKKEDPLCFSHNGHFCRVNEFSWSQSEHMTIASVDEENNLQIWCMHPGYLI